MFLHISLSITLYLFSKLFIYLSTYLPRSVSLSIFLSIYLSICYLSISFLFAMIVGLVVQVLPVWFMCLNHYIFYSRAPLYGRGGGQRIHCPNSNQNFRDIGNTNCRGKQDTTRNMPRSISLSCYISCYNSENSLFALKHGHFVAAVVASAQPWNASFF